MSKARLIAISGISGAIAVGAIVLVSVAPYLVLTLGVIASVAVSLPLIIDGKNLVYSLLVYAVSVVVSGVSGVFIGYITYVAPVALFCIPFVIVKVRGESYKVIGTVEETVTVEDPFGQGESHTVVQTKSKLKKRLPMAVKYVIYYALLEVGVGLTILITYLLDRPLFDTMYANQLVFWLLVGATQLVVPLYDILITGCVMAVNAILKKVVK